MNAPDVEVGDRVNFNLIGRTLGRTGVVEEISDEGYPVVRCDKMKMKFEIRLPRRIAKCDD